MHFSVLLIEPPGIDSQLLQVMLAAEKFHVEIAECGLDAWNLILQKTPPDLVVVDADMPFDSNIRIGIPQLLKLLHNRPAWQQIPKLILTSDRNPNFLKNAKKRGVDAVILKPYDPRRFMREVFNCLAKQLHNHINEINRQHLELGTLLMNATKSVQQRGDSGIERLLKQLSASIENHFLFEEQFMESHSYPNYFEHHKNHQLLLNKAATLITEQLGEINCISIDVVRQLREELFDDINDDKRYIEFLNELLKSLVIVPSNKKAIV
jgi:hemerythrin-like metal-binding protein